MSSRLNSWAKMIVHWGSSLYLSNSISMVYHSLKDYKSYIMMYYHLKITNLSSYPLNDYSKIKIRLGLARVRILWAIWLAEEAKIL